MPPDDTQIRALFHSFVFVQNQLCGDRFGVRIRHTWLKDSTTFCGEIGRARVWLLCRVERARGKSIDTKGWLAPGRTAGLAQVFTK